MHVVDLVSPKWFWGESPHRDVSPANTAMLARKERTREEEKESHESSTGCYDVPVFPTARFHVENLCTSSLALGFSGSVSCLVTQGKEL